MVLECPFEGGVMKVKIDLDFDGLEARIDEVLPTAIAAAAEHIRAVAADLTPIETGHLVGSASVIPDGKKASVYYPGPYARNQHYSLDFHHNVGQALYLEQPGITEVQKVTDIVAAAIRGVL
jgi:hypothetical protein